MLRAIEWIVLGGVGTAAIISGVAWHRPARVAPWVLLAVSLVSLAGGDVFYALDRQAVAGVFYLAMFVFVALGLVQLTRGGALLGDRARLIDLCASACAALLLVWVFVVGDHGSFGKIPAADVIGDLLLIGVAGRLVMAARRNWSAILLTAGATAMLASDIAYALAPSHVSETGYVVLYLSWGAAALHPSMVRLTQPAPARPSPFDGRWAALLGLSVATPPAVLLIEALTGGVSDGVVIAVASGVTLLLTITRLSDSLVQHAQALARERGLREASAALVAAADMPAVDEAVRQAVAQLLPPQAIERIVFAPDDRQMALAALPTTDAGPRSRSWWADEPEATLVCPLWLEPLAVARPGGGALVLTGRRDFLAAARDMLEVVAGQAALALDRITLVEAMGRRDSDLYLRAVIRNTAELMLVIDEDQRVRYASPALRSLLAVEELPPLTTLPDLVHTDDRAEVRAALSTGGDGVVFFALRRADDTQTLIEATYRDLRADRLVQGFVVTLRDVTSSHDPAERLPQPERMDELPAWVNRRSAQHKFRY